MAICGIHSAMQMNSAFHGSRLMARSRGMTLLELMMAVTVLGILLAIAVPSFRNYTIGSRVSAASSDLVTAMNLARSEALRRSSPAVLCASADEATCSGDTDWATGWVVFTDPNGNGAVDADELLQVWSALSGQVAAAADVDRVTYNTMGMVAAAANFSIASAGCAVDRQVDTTVSVSGGIRSNRVTCGS